MTTEESVAAVTKQVSKLRKSIAIDVSLEDIQKAKIANSKRCMMHRAITRDYPQFKMLYVDKNHIRFTEGDFIYTFEQSPIAHSMVLKWDAGENIAPFLTRLNNPIIRERVIRKKSDGRTFKTAAANEDSIVESKGAIMRPRTKSGKAKAGQDRVFGQKLWPYELKKLRDALGIEPAASEA